MDWQAESVETEGRPDLTARVPAEHPRLVIEAKFEHLIETSQLKAYADYLSRHRDSGPRRCSL